MSFSLIAFEWNQEPVDLQRKRANIKGIEGNDILSSIGLYIGYILINA